MTNKPVKLIKKPVESEGILWDGTNKEEVEAFLAGFGFVKGDYVDIGTLEGLMVASIGDWILREGNYEYYPIKPDILAKTYDFL